jgi:hypothetical protein
MNFRTSDINIKAKDQAGEKLIRCLTDAVKFSA